MRGRELEGKQGDDGVKGRECQFYEQRLITHIIRDSIHVQQDSSCANSKGGVSSGMYEARSINPSWAATLDGLRTVISWSWSGLILGRKVAFLAEKSCYINRKGC